MRAQGKRKKLNLERKLRLGSAWCQQVAKEMPYDVVNLNPQKVGSDSEPSRGRLQLSRWAERDFLRKGGVTA